VALGLVAEWLVAEQSAFDIGPGSAPQFAFACVESACAWELASMLAHAAASLVCLLEDQNL